MKRSHEVSYMYDTSETRLGSHGQNGMKGGRRRGRSVHNVEWVGMTSGIKEAKKNAHVV